MKKSELIEKIKEQHLRDLESLIELLERELPEEMK